MVYRRVVRVRENGEMISKGKRPSWYFEARTRTGYRQMCTHTADKKLAGQIEHMWDVLSSRHRAWDLLDPALADSKKIGPLFDSWSESKQDIEAMRRKAADVDIEPLVAEWNTVMKTQVGADWAAHALKHVRDFFPEGTPRLTSAVTAEWLTATLAAYAGKRNTRRKVHSSLSIFLGDYCTTLRKVFAVSPMAEVDRPAHELTPPVFYDAVTVARVIGWQPDDARRAFFALVYGTGADVSPALAVEFSDFNAASHEVRIMGTKTAFRDRIVRLADWAWPIVWSYAKKVLHARVFPAEWNRWTVSDWHRQTVGDGVKDTHGQVTAAGLKLSRRLPLRKARHHFAVRLLEAGTPVRVVAEQLGSDERTVLKHYGPWITSAEDRAKWEKIATKHETKRRKAK